MTLLHVAPRLPPLLDGIGDYADRLAKELQAKFATENLFLSADRAQKSRNELSVLKSHSAQAFVSELENLRFDRILLHYCGYGFHQRGVPLWLLRGLNAFLKKKDIPLIVFFHELWASGKPWKSEFYLGPLQRQIATNLRDLAQVSITSTPLMAKLLNGKALIAPIPSAIPALRDVADRRREGPLRLLIFGQEHTRERSVTAHLALLKQLASHSMLDRLVLAGKGAGRTGGDYQAAGRVISSDRIETLSDATAEQLQEQFRQADLCLSYYPSHLATKSSTVTAALACGCPLVLPRSSETGPNRIQFEPRIPFIVCDGSEEDTRDLFHQRATGSLDQIARRALAWYREHASWEVHAAGFAAALN